MVYDALYATASPYGSYDQIALRPMWFDCVVTIYASYAATDMVVDMYASLMWSTYENLITFVVYCSVNVVDGKM